MALRRFIIERDIPKVGSLEREQLQGAAAKSNETLRSLGPDPVSARTVRRDLELLRELGIPIRAIRTGRSTRYTAHDDGPEFRLDGAKLAPDIL